MELYHGTFETNYKSIKSDKAIIPQYGANRETNLIDVALNEFLGDVNIRHGAIFLSSEMKYINCYDYLLSIKVEKLNKNLLYVADFRVSTDIYEAILRSKEDNEVKALCKKYAETFMTFGAYLAQKEKIEIPEFLYFGEIKTKDTNTVDEFAYFD